MSLLLLFGGSSGTTVSCTVGNAVAAGAAALIQIAVQAGVGNAVADGATANIYQGATVQATVGNAVADGSTAAIKRAISAGVGNAVADGSTATISSGLLISATTGAGIADGLLATINMAIWPAEADVLLGVTYGPTGVEYTGTFVGFTGDLKLDVATGRMVKVLTDKVVLSF